MCFSSDKRLVHPMNFLSGSDIQDIATVTSNREESPPPVFLRPGLLFLRSIHLDFKNISSPFVGWPLSAMRPLWHLQIYYYCNVLCYHCDNDLPSVFPLTLILPDPMATLVPLKDVVFTGATRASFTTNPSRSVGTSSISDLHCLTLWITASFISNQPHRITYYPT